MCALLVGGVGMRRRAWRGRRHVADTYLPSPQGGEPRQDGRWMELGDDPEEAAFRAEARAWLADHVGPYRVDVDPDSPSLVFADVDDVAHLERGRAWQRE